MNIVHVARAVGALSVQQPDEAHLALQAALDNLEQYQDESRSALHTYDLALPFYRQRGDLAALNRVLEGRLRLMESMRSRVTSIFSHLHTQTTQLQQARHELSLSRAEMIERLSAIGERRDDATGKHTRRVAFLVLHMARALNLPDAADLAEAARLHDLGKVSLPDSILMKPGPLSPEERAQMQQHTVVGAEMLSGGYSHVLTLAQIIARSHHERWDGQGYPDGLKGQDIPLAARLVAVADVYDALISQRPYKESWTPEDARAELRRQAGRHFDPQVVDILERVLSEQTLPPDLPHRPARPRGG